jgi:uncharacterized protein YkwD
LKNSSNAMEPDVSRILALVFGMFVLALCAVLPSISFADQGDDLGNRTAEPFQPTPSPERSPFPNDQTPPATMTPSSDDQPMAAERDTLPTSLQSVALAVQYKAFLPIVMGGAGNTNVSTQTFEEQVVELVNAERQQAGCAPLALAPELTNAAIEHSADMANHDFFAHTGSDGSSPWDRMDRAGYQWLAAAENIAASARTPAEVVAMWMNSPGHRANILNCSLHDTGLGYVRLDNDTGNVNYHTYWTQVFGSR